MKIEIDLNDILGDEQGAETLQESIRRQVIQHLSDKTRKETERQISETVAKTIDEALSGALKERIPAIIDDIMNAEYTPVERYGQQKEPTSFRAELLKGIQKELVYAPRTYSSEENAFTKAVKAVIEDHLNGFKKEFQATITQKFMADCIGYARDQLVKLMDLTITKK